MANRTFDKRIVRIIAESNLLSEEDLQQAQEAAVKEKSSVTSVLVQKGLVEENDLLGVLAEKLRVTPINLHDCVLNPDVVRTVGQDTSVDNSLIAISRIENVLTVAVSNPFDVVVLDDVRNTTGCELRLVLALEESISVALNRVFNPGAAELEAVMGEMGSSENIELSAKDDVAELDLEAIAASDDESPVIKFVNLVIYNGIKDRVSDIHIEPFERRVRVRYRADGVCYEAYTPPKSLHNSIVSRIKIMCGLDIAERRRPQDGKFQIKMEGRQVDFRVSVLPTVHGEKVVLRILDGGNLALSLETLGFETKALDDFSDAIRSSYGMILVTGPTGSGKSTTLYSAVKEIMSDESNFVTVEDPVEYQLFGVNQVQVHEKRGLTFAAALRSILRQDPDVVMIGEIRDKETIEIAIKAALTGHLVLSTLHTNDAASTISRMIDMGVDPFMVASATLLVSAQRLARRLCKYCKVPMDKPPVERLLEVGFLPEEAETAEIFKPVGCPRCKGGYAGRFALLETMPMNEDIKRMVIQGKSALDIKNDSILEHGMITLRRAAVLNAMRGITSIEEVLRVTMPDEVQPDGRVTRKQIAGE
ncbi:MAG: GspE/PulE family protein [Planctomycetota bacterium]|jgi:type IV pilus assembly protein PilB